MIIMNTVNRNLAVILTCLTSIHCGTPDAEIQLGIFMHLDRINRTISNLTVDKAAADGLSMLCVAIDGQNCTSEDFTVDRTRLLTIVQTANSFDDMCMRLNVTYSQMEAEYTTKYNATVARSIVVALGTTVGFINCSTFYSGGVGGGGGGGGGGSGGVTVAGGGATGGGMVTGVTQPAGGVTGGGPGMQSTAPPPSFPTPPAACTLPTDVTAGSQCVAYLTNYEAVVQTVPCTDELMASLCNVTDAVSQCYANLSCLTDDRTTMLQSIPVFGSFNVPYWLYLRYKWNATQALCKQRAVLLNNTQCVMQDLVGVNGTRFTPSNPNNASLVCAELEAYYSETLASFTAKYNAATAAVVVDSLKQYYKAVKDGLQCEKLLPTTTAAPAGNNHSPGVASALPLTVLTVVSTLVFMAVGRQ